MHKMIGRYETMGRYNTDMKMGMLKIELDYYKYCVKSGKKFILLDIFFMTTLSLVYMISNEPMDNVRIVFLTVAMSILANSLYQSLDKYREDKRTLMQIETTIKFKKALEGKE